MVKLDPDWGRAHAASRKSADGSPVKTFFSNEMDFKMALTLLLPFITHFDFVILFLVLFGAKI